MSIFRRGAKAASVPALDDERDSNDSGDTGATGHVDGSNDISSDDASSNDIKGADGVVDAGDVRDDASATPEANGSGGREASSFSRSDGPFDRSEVSDSEGRVDLGSLWVTGLPGMELRLEVDEAQTIVAANAVVGDSAVHLQAFAAPRSEGVWDEIRSEIAASITRQGGTADETVGPLGTELLTQMPAPGPGGRTGFTPARFVGVDGPRWFLRAVISGRAAQDATAAQPLLDIVRGTVVVRGEEAMAPRDLLPLALPPEVAEAAEAADAAPNAGSGPDDGAAAGGSMDDLRPFERGPEITEIR